MSNEMEKIADLSKHILNSKGEVLFIIGAGASAETGVPTSTTLKKELAVPGLKEEELRDILYQNGIRVPSEMPFEAFITAYQELFGYDYSYIDKFLESRLPKIDDRPSSTNKYFKKPSLSYALLSHLVKNNFAKYIISLNFDELFEKALNEELGHQFAYERVASRSAFGHFRDYHIANDKLFDIDDRIFLFKPHGTISYKMTLRSTWESVKKLDEEKFEVLMQICKACNVWIFVGYGFWDLDITPLFLHVAHKHMEDGWSAWFINHNEEFLEKNHRVKGLLSMVRGEDYAKDYFIAMDSSRFFRKITNELVTPDTDNPSIYYRKGYSHRIEDILFDSGLEPSDDNRLLIAIILLALITKGKFTELSIAQFPRLVNIIGREAIYKKKISESIESKFKGLIEEYHLGEKFFYLLGENENEIILKIIEKIESEFLDNGTVKHKKKLTQLMLELLNEYDITISPSADIPLLFNSLKTTFITNLEEFKKETKEIINASKHLCIIAETGEWLLRDSRLNDKKIELIISNPKDDYKKSYHRKRALDKKNELKAKGNIDIYTIPSCINVHHVTLGVEKKEGIYFYRKGKAPTIQPIKVVESDFDRIHDFFNNLKMKAQQMGALDRYSAAPFGLAP